MANAKRAALAAALLAALAACEKEPKSSESEKPRAERTSSAPTEYLRCDAPNDCTGIALYEDGSGVQYLHDQEVRTFPAGTFYWDCSQMGNMICGSN